MSNAAILFHSEAFDTGHGKLMGRHAAGESFLRGYLRHAQVDQFYLWNWGNEPVGRLQELVRAIEPTKKPITWIGQREPPRFAEPGTLFVSSPANAPEAWNRRLIGPTRYSICGLTHTTASGGVMDTILDMLTAPVEPWDSLICTSRAVRDSTETQFAMTLEYLRERLGPISPPPLRVDVIPLGVNTSDFARSDQSRRDWRERLGVGEEAIVVLYVGRFSAHAKMNPVPMAMALEKAAKRTRRPVHWVMSGWAASDLLHASFTGAARRFAPSVQAHILDGRKPEVRFPIWSAADIFLSLSDNIQETFGLTPLEAMAAGLPTVVSDWDGYRDLVRHQVDGFRIPTLAPRPGLGGDIAFAHANGFESYDRYIGTTSQFAAADVDAAAEALVTLIENDDLRLRMGRSAQERARTTFDWATIVPQYQALWDELGQIRRAAPPKPPGSANPRRPDPFTLFAGYPTRALERSAKVAATPGGNAAAALAVLKDPTVSYAVLALPTEPIIARVFDLLAARGEATVAEVIEHFPPAQRGMVERGLLWLAKFGLVTISPRPIIPQP